MIKQTLDQLAIEMNTLSGITDKVEISLPINCIEDLQKDVYSKVPPEIASRMACDFKKYGVKTLIVYKSVNGIDFWITPIFYDRSDKDLDRELDRMEREIVHYE
jgi:hypothetical protein